MASPLKREQDVQGIVDKFRARIAQEAENLVSTFFPQKLSELDSWVQELRLQDLSRIRSLLIPKVEDGNNFGVSIQEDTVDQLWTVESTAASYLRRFSTYYNTRAKLVSKIVKYPQVEDYHRTVAEVDENEYLSVRQILLHLRNQYATLHDVILKNIEKIKTPRSTNSNNLY
ncbi:PREDICTED: proteasome activator complex subunit 3-like [Galeopterus variegatus]|uniref:Proteasome activator complex subunit 3-like n=1 Tax=Galeopterus variegatus TaxID=482537 RepID=A0ABM0QTU0_GALVR|nr:PREDICTED: proteasome activator complex subunit 3-like [Galeopterus variegatus]